MQKTDQKAHLNDRWAFVMLYYVKKFTYFSYFPLILLKTKLHLYHTNQ